MSFKIKTLSYLNSTITNERLKCDGPSTRYHSRGKPRLFKICQTLSLCLNFNTKNSIDDEIKIVIKSDYHESFSF